ncbi:MAG: hypothetical protein Q4D29_12360 [Lachnospiraceae bacterium]|nr:hypothetical protein [Lachnospiraceae bacterium]
MGKFTKSNILLDEEFEFTRLYMEVGVEEFNRALVYMLDNKISLERIYDHTSGYYDSESVKRYCDEKGLSSISNEDLILSFTNSHSNANELREFINSLSAEYGAKDNTKDNVKSRGR